MYFFIFKRSKEIIIFQALMMCYLWNTYSWFKIMEEEKIFFKFRCRYKVLPWQMA